MALDLMGYIEKSSKRPNRAILESLGASQELIEYLMDSPENTNWRVVEAIGIENIKFPYTFHFETKVLHSENNEEITGIVCEEKEKWIQIWNSFGNGKIPTVTFSNCIDNFGNSVEFVPTEMNSYKGPEQHGQEFTDNNNNNITFSMPTELFLESIEMPDEEIEVMKSNVFCYTTYLSSCDITIDVIDGYVINCIGDMQDVIKYIKTGESWISDNDYISKTNNYSYEDIIIPTSDLILFPIGTIYYNPNNSNKYTNLLPSEFAFESTAWKKMFEQEVGSFFIKINDFEFILGDAQKSNYILLEGNRAIDLQVETQQYKLELSINSDNEQIVTLTNLSTNELVYPRLIKADLDS